LKESPDRYDIIFNNKDEYLHRILALGKTFFENLLSHSVNHTMSKDKLLPFSLIVVLRCNNQTVLLPFFCCDVEEVILGGYVIRTKDQIFTDAECRNTQKCS
jgi:hypothetical protein